MAGVLSVRVATLAALGALLHHVAALRHMEDELDEVHLDASEYVKFNPEDFEEMVTPRHSDEILQLRLGAVGTSALEVNDTESSARCRGKYREPEKMLGQGNYGTVYLVATNTENSEYYALKVPNDNSAHAIEAAQHEIEVMEAVNKGKARNPVCSYVLSMLEKNPCVGGKIYLNGIVMPLVSWDLQKWKNKRSIPSKCESKVTKAVLDGLTCMHEAGWVHGDVKADNIFFHGFDKNNCPEGVEVADFGISKKIGALDFKFDQKWYALSGHLPGDVFDGSPEPLKIATTVTYQGRNGRQSAEGYRADARVDLCSFAYLVYDLFKVKSKLLQEKLGGAGKCGRMGPGRRWSLP